jgi:TonB family protein
MKARLNSAQLTLGCLLILGCSTALAPTAWTQDAASEPVKRKLKTKVVPDYPAIARQLSLQGKVRIETTVSADGHVTNTKVVGGNPVLASAAVDAVKKWRFEPGPKETTELIEIDYAGRN